MSPQIRITQGCILDGEVRSVGDVFTIEDTDRAEQIIREGFAQFNSADDEKAATDANGGRKRQTAAEKKAAAKAAEAEADAKARAEVQHADGVANDGNANGGIPPANPDQAQGRAEENAAVTAKTTGAESGPPVGTTRAPKAKAAVDSSAEPGAIGGDAQAAAEKAASEGKK